MTSRILRYCKKTLSKVACAIRPSRGTIPVKKGPLAWLICGLKNAKHPAARIAKALRYAIAATDGQHD